MYETIGFLSRYTAFITDSEAISYYFGSATWLQLVLSLFSSSHRASATWHTTPCDSSSRRPSLIGTSLMDIPAQHLADGGDQCFSSSKTDAEDLHLHISGRLRDPTFSLHSFRPQLLRPRAQMADPSTLAILASIAEYAEYVGTIISAIKTAQEVLGQPNKQQDEVTQKILEAIARAEASVIDEIHTAALNEHIGAVEDASRFWGNNWLYIVRGKNPPNHH